MSVRGWKCLLVSLSYACKAKRRQTRYVPLIYLHEFRIRKKETSPFSLFATKRHWTEKHIPLCLWGQKMTNALYTIDLPPCISNQDKGNVSFFLIRYETELDRKTYTSMACVQNTTNVLYAIDLLPCISNNENGKCLLFSLWNGVGQKNIYHFACKTERRQKR